MNKIIPFPQPHRVHDEACRWLGILDGSASQDDKDNFSRWLTESPENARVFIKVASVWDQMNALEDLAEIFPLQSYEMAKRKAITRRGVMVGGAVVLGALLFAGAGLAGLDFGPATRTFETAVGKQITVSLSDGSGVVLNTDTLIHVTYSEDERTVRLIRGEALFTVAKDASRPFRVYTGKRVVEAVGTAFTVHRNLQEAVEVLVTEGQVKFLKLPEPQNRDSRSPAAMEDAGADGISLKAGEYAAAGEDAAEVRTMQMGQNEIESRLAWRHGMLLFQGDPLQRVLDEVSRYTLIRIEADPAIRDLVVRGYIRAGDVDGLLVMMKENFEIVAQKIDEDHIVLVGGASSGAEQ